ncbi:MAG TPA: hypothetical protein VJ385_14420, partial [Fibrobacteria bacterium]|nr:hypothetical protein [Fibrobacteria bacterium]
STYRRAVPAIHTGRRGDAPETMFHAAQARCSIRNRLSSRKNVHIGTYSPFKMVLETDPQINTFHP